MKLPLAFAGVLLAACRTPPPQDVPPPDVEGLGTTIGDACATIRKLGCPEGELDPKTGRTCFQTLTHASTTLRVDVPTACLTASVSKDAVRLCGDANMIRVRCVTPPAP